MSSILASIGVVIWALISITLVSLVLGFIPAAVLWYVLPIVLPFVNANYINIWLLVSSLIMILRSAK